MEGAKEGTLSNGQAQVRFQSAKTKVKGTSRGFKCKGRHMGLEPVGGKQGKVGADIPVRVKENAKWCLKKSVSEINRRTMRVFAEGK